MQQISANTVHSRALFDAGAVTSSDYYNDARERDPQRARFGPAKAWLHNTAGAWSPRSRSNTAHITMRFSSPKRVLAVRTQGQLYGRRHDFVTAYAILYQTERDAHDRFGGHFVAPGGARVFAGNADATTVVTHVLSTQNVTTRAVRIVVEEGAFTGYPTLRFDVVFA